MNLPLLHGLLPTGATHTPGPWVWRNGQVLGPALPDPQHHAVHTILDAGGHGGRGFLGSKPSQTMVELRADFRLIVAAPKLLAALLALRSACSLVLAGSSVMQDADAAIAQAVPQ